jgi:hypothetical protein
VQLLAQVADFVLRLIDHVAAGFGVMALGEAVPDGPDAAAHPVAGVDDGYRRPGRREVVGCGEAGEAGACDEHADAG